MTENEAKEILLQIAYDGEYPIGSSEAFSIAIQALEEIQQYRAIGTVEETQKKMEELERWHTDRINENIKNPFAYTSTLICHNCDHKDEYIEELESEVAEYKTIGTIEEFKALKEKECKCEDCAGCTNWKCDCYNIRAKAIDEFVNLVNECSGYTPNCIEHDLSLTVYTIHQIAEEMRGAE